jgi:3',5'-cyclic AMP phosphodiesterase CpdA
MSFAIISDPHVFPRQLGVEDEGFSTYLAKDRKLLGESTELLDEAVKAVKVEDVDFVLVPGDLTKDGELVSHQMAAEYLAELAVTVYSYNVQLVSVFPVPLATKTSIRLPFHLTSS